MQKELITFEGGINNLIAPHLIPENTTPYVTNSDIISGVLESAREPKLRIDLPFIGNNTIYYKAQDELVGSAQHLLDAVGNPDEDRFYVEWAGFLYWSNYVGDGSGKLQRYDGTSVVDLGQQVAPTVAHTSAVGTTGLLNGDYSYCYTYVYDDVFESAPSPIVNITPVANQSVNITFPAYAGTATHMILYRSGGLNPTFNQVEKIEIVPAGHVYNDNTSDFNISRRELNTTSNDAPPADIDMLVESFGTLFGVVGNRVHFSREGQPEYWSNYNYVELPTTVTGLGVIGDYIVAFTDYNMYLITGRNIHDIAIRKLPYQYGCLSKRSVKNLKGNLIWLTRLEEYYLICSFSGGAVSILNYANPSIASDKIGSLTYDDFTTETYDDFELGLSTAIVIGRKYMLFMYKRTVVVDMEFDTKIYYMDETILGAYEYNNSLIVCKDDGLGTTKGYQYIVSNAGKRNLTYQTKDLIGGSLITDKSYRKVSVNAEGSWTIIIYVDNASVFTFDYTQGATIFLPSGIHGKTISFKITSSGYAKIKALQYEYKVLNDGFNTVA